MPERENPKIRLGVSACLLGEAVRHDGGHKKDAFLTDTLGPFVEWIPVCPEVEIGLGIPRDTIRLVGDAEAPRLVVEKTGRDLTESMRRYAAAKTRELEALGLHGYVFKRASPTCGLFRVRVHHPSGMRASGGRGLYARALVERFPTLPVEEEGRLTDAAIRENFIERVFAAARWRAFLEAKPRPRDLVAFHAAQKFAVLAHSPAHYARLERLVAGAGSRVPRAAHPAGRAPGTRYGDYGALFMEALAVRATRARHTNVLQHLAGFFKRALDAPSRAALGEVIQEYRRGLVPLVVPLTLVKHYVRRFELASLTDQVYLDPHPKELMR
jgi:uncharacterized protein YbgA (DUF1722 family)/uncharacterized protein YbbK (DUF523 family)